MSGKVGQRLLDVVHRAQAVLERLEVPPEEVAPLLQERRFRDTFSDPLAMPTDLGANSTHGVDNWLTSDAFKQKFEAAVDGTSYRASEAKKVETSYAAMFHKDTYTPPPSAAPPVA